MSEIFDKAVKEAGLASLGEIPSPFEVARKLGLNIPTMKDIQNILSFVGPQADIQAMVEESSRVIPALKKGDYPEAISSLGLAALAPLMIGIPGTVSGIRKGTQEFTDVVKIPYRRRNIYLRFRAEGDGKNFDIKSYEDKNLLNRAWQPRYDDRIFDSEEEFMKTYNRIKKKEIKEPSSPSEGIASLGEPSSVEQAVQKSVKNYKAKKINPGQYEYRGYEIYNPADDFDTYTHWNITPPGETGPSDATNTLWQAKEFIDELIDLGKK